LLQELVNPLSVLLPSQQEHLVQQALQQPVVFRLMLLAPPQEQLEARSELVPQAQWKTAVAAMLDLA
jgi:hypothetical protein